MDLRYIAGGMALAGALGALFGVLDLYRFFTGKARRMSKLFYLGSSLLALPILMACAEYAYARMIGATGERLASAGFYGVVAGVVTVIPGVTLFLVGAMKSLGRN
jgi:hypothetical protein